MLLAKTLRSTTFKLALISIGVFGAIVIALFGYVYWSTARFVLSRSDSAIEAEWTTLRNAYETSGREGLIQAIEQRSAADHLEGGVYLLADQSFGPVAGNLKAWPALKRPGEWSEFSYNALNSKTAASQSMFRSSIERGASDHDQALISEALADLDDVLRMFSSLTRISQIEADNRRAAFRTVNLGEIATEVAELFDAAAEGKGGRVEVFGDKAVRISADRDLLFDAISNLVDNAIKHGREGGVVIIHLDQKDSEAILSVSDDKPCCYPPCSMDRPRSRQTSAN